MTKAESFSDLELHFIELDKNAKELENKDLAEWCLFLRNRAMIDKDLIHQPSIKRAYEELERLSQDENARALYEARMKQIRDFESAYWDAKDQGFADGLNQGIAEGKAAAKAEAKFETMKELVTQIHKNGLSISQIASVTSITEEEIKNLLEYD